MKSGPVRAAGPDYPRLAQRGLRFVHMSKRRQLHSTSTRVLSIAMIVIGVVLIVRTLAAGGGALATGLVLGILFVLAGVARLYLQLRG